MTTGAFWDETNPARPWGLFDRDAQLDIPFDWASWLADVGATYVSHTIEPDPMLEEVESSVAGGVIRALIKVADGAEPVIGVKYPVTCHIVADSSGMELKDDRTVWLKIAER